MNSQLKIFTLSFAADDYSWERQPPTQNRNSAGRWDREGTAKYSEEGVGERNRGQKRWAKL